MEPSTRFELVTSSLPWLSSTDGQDEDAGSKPARRLILRIIKVHTLMYERSVKLQFYFPTSIIP